MQHGADVNPPLTEEYLYRYPPLYWAVDKAHVDMVKLLVESGANLNAQNNSKYWCRSALELAVVSNQIEVIHILLDAGADVDNCMMHAALSFEDKPTLTATEWSFLEHRTRVYQILSKYTRKGQDDPSLVGILQAAERGTQALYAYVAECAVHHSSGIETLLETALCRAAHFSWHVAASSLLEVGVDPNVGRTDPSKISPPLLSAVEFSDIDLTQLLLDGGADANDEFILKIASVNDNVEDSFQLLSLFLNHGADFRAHGALALGYAASCNELESVQFLVSYGADINAPNCFHSMAPLQLAAQHHALEVAKYLVSVGADINAPPNPLGGRTALQAAAEVQDIDMVKFLLGKGAKSNAPPSKIRGVTALEAALNGKKRIPEATKAMRREVFKALLDAGADANTSHGGAKGNSLLCSVITEDLLDLIPCVLEAGVDVNQGTSGKTGRTPIQAAAEIGNLEVLKLLLDVGANINAPALPDYGRTALQAATSTVSPNLSVIQFLLSLGADVNAPAALKGGVTALQGAVIQGHTRIALLLLSKGADVNAPAAAIQGRTAFEGAAEHGRLDLLQILLNAGAGGSRPDDSLTERRFDTAIELAKGNGHTAVVSLLQANHHGAVL